MYLSFLGFFFQKNSFLIDKVSYICICIIHILSSFVFLICQAFLTWTSGSEVVQILPTSLKLNKLFYSVTIWLSK